MTKTAVITGITGQDGSYLAEHLLDEEYEVIGVARRSSTNTYERVAHITSDKFTIVEGDISDPSSMYEIVREYEPDEFYNLAAQSHVGTSFKQPGYTFMVDAVGPLNCLEAIRVNKPDCRFYQASTSELFGSNVTRCHVPMTPVSGDKVYQDEDTPFAPNSPYAAAKMAAHNLVHVYRESYGLHACCGILFNHESERRGENFVTRKITKWVAGLKECLNRKTVIALESHDKDTLYYSSKLGGSWHFPKLRLGNIDAYRDWGHAEDYVRAMHLMTQKKEPKDYVISTGKTHRVRDFLQEALACIGVDNYEDYFVVDPQFYRPCEVEYLCGDSSKAQRELDWKPEISFKQLVQRMVESDINVS